MRKAALYFSSIYSHQCVETGALVGDAVGPFFLPPDSEDPTELIVHREFTAITAHRIFNDEG